MERTSYLVHKANWCPVPFCSINRLSQENAVKPRNVDTSCVGSHCFGSHCCPRVQFKDEQRQTWPKYSCDVIYVTVPVETIVELLFPIKRFVAFLGYKRGVKFPVAKFGVESQSAFVAASKFWQLSLSAAFNAPSFTALLHSLGVFLFLFWGAFGRSWREKENLLSLQEAYYNAAL